MNPSETLNIIATSLAAMGAQGGGLSSIDVTQLAEKLRATAGLVVKIERALDQIAEDAAEDERLLAAAERSATVIRFPRRNLGTCWVEPAGVGS